MLGKRFTRRTGSTKMADKQNSTDSSKAWTVTKLRQELEKALPNGLGVSPDLSLTAQLLWKQLPLELLPLLPVLDGVTFCHLDKVTTEQVLAVRKPDGWGFTPSRELHVRLDGPTLEGEYDIVEAKAVKATTKSLHQALYLLTN
jgi:hypothetical protein